MSNGLESRNEAALFLSTATFAVGGSELGGNRRLDTITRLVYQAFVLVSGNTARI